MTRKTCTSTVRVLLGATIAFALVTSVGVVRPTEAAAAGRAKLITRTKVIDRSKSWVKRRVSYSQNRIYKGYRRDCSGFVSMAWKLGRSYSTKSIGAVSHRVKRSKAKPGDAVLYRGHVVIFGKWKNKKRGTFVAYEQTTWGSHAKRRVRVMAGGTVMRRDGIEEKRVAAKMKPRRVVARIIAHADGSGSTATAVTVIGPETSLLP